MSGWKLNTVGVDHSLVQNGTNLILQPGSYAVIVQNIEAFMADYPNVSQIIDSSWSDLSNSAPKPVWLKNSSLIFDNVTYSLAGEGNSSCLLSNFTTCIPTPGAANANSSATTSGSNATANAIADATFSFLVDAASVNATYSLFKINLTGKDCAKLDNVTMTFNITPDFTSSLSVELGCNATIASWKPAVAGSYVVCGSLANNTFIDSNLSNNAACKTVVVSEKQCSTSVAILSESIVNAGSQMEFKLVMSDSLCNESSIDVEYWIEDMFESYVKPKLNTTQEFICSKSVDRQWTPNMLVGTEGYKIKAALKTNCQDLNASDNFAEKIIVVKGSSSGSSVSSGQSSQPASPATQKPIEIMYYPLRIYADESFETLVNVSINTTFSIYSYVFSGSTPVSEWSGRRTWDANRIENTSSGLISLPNKIENGTGSGNYTMRVKVKSDRDYEASRMIEILSRPKLSIEKINSSYFLSADCEDCEITIIGHDFEKTVKGVYSLNLTGTFNVFLTKDSKMFSKERITIENVQEPKKNQKAAMSPTGFAAKKSQGGKINYVIFAQILSKMKLF